MYSPSQIVMLVLSGGLLGMLGQGLRVIAGLKKAHDQARSENLAFTEVFEANQVLVSLLIGFVAGALAMLALPETDKLGREAVFALIGAGYAGADAIEAFMKQYLPGGRGSAAVAAGAPRPPA